MNGPDPQAVHTLFDQLMAVNPSVEVYLLDKQGAIIGNAAPAGHLAAAGRVAAAARCSVAPMPVHGDDPRSADGRKGVQRRAA